MKIVNFNDAHNALSQYYGSSHHYTLDNIRALMKYLGDPQDQLKVVHVAGTSGKTSTCYYIAGLLRASGKKVGLTVSPHVDEINERVQIDLQPLPEAIFCKQLEDFLVLVEASELPLSYFEVMVAFAYWYFAKVGVDYAVIEVGLGGRIDGTNIVNRTDKVCVVTNIGLDHTQILGDTLPKIAAEKAGIITDLNHVFTHNQPSEVIDVIKQATTKHRAMLHVRSESKNVLLAELPLFQQHNLGLAIDVVEYVLDRDGAQLNDHIVEVAAKTYVPARMESVQYHGKTIIIDGAHNGQKIQTLLGSIKAKYPGQTIAALVAFVDGDRARTQDALKELAPHVQSIVVTEFTSAQDVPKQSVPAETIVEAAKLHDVRHITMVKNPELALKDLIQKHEDILLVTGSFYLLNHIRPLILRV